MTYWHLVYHIVWTTKLRAPLIQPEWEGRLYGVMRRQADKLGGVIHVVGGIEDHVHLLLSSPPKHSLATVVGQLKGSSAHFVNHELCPPYHFKWQRGYAALSVNPYIEARLRAYILNQRRHHQAGTLQPRLERCAAL